MTKTTGKPRKPSATDGTPTKKKRIKLVPKTKIPVTLAPTLSETRQLFSAPEHHAPRFQPGRFGLPPQRLCNVPSCSSPHKAHGYCQAHYDMARVGKDPYALQLVGQAVTRPGGADDLCECGHTRGAHRDDRDHKGAALACRRDCACSGFTIADGKVK